MSAQRFGQEPVRHERRRRLLPALVPVVTALGLVLVPAGTATAFGPDGHHRAVDEALKAETTAHTRALLKAAVMSSDQQPYWSDGHAHCDDFDHFDYPHDYRVRDFERKTPQNVRPDTAAEVAKWSKYYSRFPTGGQSDARAASDRNLFGCVQYAFDRVNLAVHLAQDLLDSRGNPSGNLKSDVNCTQASGKTAGSGAKARHRGTGAALPGTGPVFDDHLKKNPKCNVIEQFGRGLHAIQDFYAHSNWADHEITTDVKDYAYSKNIGRFTNPKGLKETTPLPLFGFAGLKVAPVDYRKAEGTTGRVQPWRYFPPTLERKEASKLTSPGEQKPFHVSRIEEFSAAYLRTHKNVLPLDEKRYRALQSGCYTEQTLTGNRICYEARQLGHYPEYSPARWSKEKKDWYDWALSPGIGGLAKDTVTWTTDRGAADFTTGKLPATWREAKEKGSNFANSLRVATADTSRQWTYLKDRLLAAYGPERGKKMTGILRTDQHASQP
jgi:hypothetical protein